VGLGAARARHIRKAIGGELRPVISEKSDAGTGAMPGFVGSSTKRFWEGGSMVAQNVGALLKVCAIGVVLVNCQPAMGEWSGNHCIPDGNSCRQMCPPIKQSDAVYPRCWQDCDKIVSACISAAQAQSQSEQNKCGLAALRPCHSQCGGEYGMLCFVGDVCNPQTHNCEHAQP
jgi:hypothetical protein